MTPTDWLPTLAGAAGIVPKTAQPLDGVNLWTHFTKATVEPRRDLFFCVQGDRGPKQHALRDGNIKFIRIEAGDGAATPVEAMFDVMADPYETTDLLPRMTDVATSMRQRVAQWAALHPRAEVFTGGGPHPGWVTPKDWSKAAVE
jgi:arylsulfatase A-like enzyme